MSVKFKEKEAIISLRKLIPLLEERHEFLVLLTHPFLNKSIKMFTGKIFYTFCRLLLACDTQTRMTGEFIPLSIPQNLNNLIIKFI